MRRFHSVGLFLLFMMAVGALIQVPKDAAKRETSQVKPEPVPTVIYEEWWGLGYQFRAKWRLKKAIGTRGELQFEDRLIPLAHLHEIRKLAKESKPDDGVLLEFPKPVSPELIQKEMRRLFPWVKSPVPHVSQQDLERRARASLLAPSAAGSGSKLAITLSGDPPLRIELVTNGMEQWLPRHRYYGALPAYSVQLGKEKWMTRSPRLARALYKFADPQSSLSLFENWGEQFVTCEARRRGFEWARTDLFASYQEWPGGSEISEKYSLIDAVDMSDILTANYAQRLRFKPKAPTDYEVDVRFNLEGQKSLDWRPMVAQLEQARLLLERPQWQRISNSRDHYQIVLSRHFNFPGARWESTGMKGDALFGVTCKESGKTFQFGAEDERILFGMGGKMYHIASDGTQTLAK